MICAGQHPEGVLLYGEMELCVGKLHGPLVFVFIFVLELPYFDLIGIYDQPDAICKFWFGEYKHFEGAEFIIFDIIKRTELQELKRIQTGLFLVHPGAQWIIIFHVYRDELIYEIFHIAGLMSFNEPWVFESLPLPVCDDDGSVPSVAMVHKLTEIIFVVLLDVLIDVVIIIVVIIESLALVNILAVVAQWRKHWIRAMNLLILYML